MYICRHFERLEQNSEKMIAIFASDRSLEILKKAEIISVDGTFGTAPAPFYQIFVFQVKNMFLTL